MSNLSPEFKERLRILASSDDGGLEVIERFLKQVLKEIRRSPVRFSKHHATYVLEAVALDGGWRERDDE